jgi:endonuclease/exonuclease/phosphatase (EEP) superfamily protein YafD
LGTIQGPVRVATASIAAGALAGSLAFTVLWLLQPESYWFVLVTSYTPYAFPGYLIATAALLLIWRGTEQTLRRWISGALVVSVLGAVFHAILLAPLYVGHHPSGPADLTVISLNAKRGNADAGDVVAMVKAEKAQVLVLVEVTPALRSRLSTAGLDALLPNIGGEPGEDASGTMVFSAYPLTEKAALPLTHGGYRFRVAAPTPFWLVAVHMGQPLNKQGRFWRADWSVLEQVVPALQGSVIMSGDMNTTLEHRTMRTLLGEGFTDAARQANSGWQPTYPATLGFIAIDHVLTRGDYGAVSTRTQRIGGSDHRALIARLAVVGRG